MLQNNMVGLHMTTYYQIIFSGAIASMILTSLPDLSVIWDVLISFAVSFITILGSKFISYLSKKLDDSIDLKSKFTEDNDNVVQEKKEEK